MPNLPNVEKRCIVEKSVALCYVGVGAAAPVISDSSPCTGAQVQKRLVSPYAKVTLAKNQ
jgi:hypothetical protein